MGPEQIRAIRQFKRMTQTEFGAELGLSARAVRQWEAGINRVTRERAAQILRTFDVAPESLLPECEPSPLRSRVLNLVMAVPDDKIQLAYDFVRAFVVGCVIQPEEPRKR